MKWVLIVLPDTNVLTKTDAQRMRQRRVPPPLYSFALHRAMELVFSIINLYSGNNSQSYFSGNMNVNMPVKMGGVNVTIQKTLDILFVFVLFFNDLGPTKCPRCGRQFLQGVWTKPTYEWSA